MNKCKEILFEIEMLLAME